MSIRIGRLSPVGFAKRGAAPTDPVAPGAFTSPTQFPRYIPPFNWRPAIALLESPAVSNVREIPVKAVKGAGSLSGLKLGAELEPTDVFGHLLMSSFGKDTVTGDGILVAHAHNFEALEQAQLPTYDFWEYAGNKELGYAGLMTNKLDVTMAKAAVIKVENDFTGLFYVDGLSLFGVVTPTYPAPRPLTFAQTNVTIGGTANYDVTNLKLSLENKVNVDHVLRSDTNYGSRIWTEEAMATVEMEMLFEDAVEYNKFLNAADPASPTPTSVESKTISAETFVDGTAPATAFSFDFLMGKVDYRTAEVDLPTGVLRVKFAGVALPFTGSIGSGGNAYSFTAKPLVVQFINGVVAAY